MGTYPYYHGPRKGLRPESSKRKLSNHANMTMTIERAWRKSIEKGDNHMLLQNGLSLPMLYHWHWAL